MGQAAKAPRENRTITVDFHDDSTYFQLMNDGKAFVEFVFAFPHSPEFSGGEVQAHTDSLLK